MHIRRPPVARVYGPALFTAALVAAASAVLAGPTPPRAPAPARTPSPARAVPAPQPPLINLTATLQEPRRAQIRLAGFIIAIQAKNWARAVTYLSQRVTAAERRQMMTGPWMRRQNLQDPAALYYMPQIEIRTKVFRPTAAALRVLPYRWDLRRGHAFGFMDIWMVRENDKWMVNVHPNPRTPIVH